MKKKSFAQYVALAIWAAQISTACLNCQQPPANTALTSDTTYHFEESDRSNQKGNFLRHSIRAKKGNKEVGSIRFGSSSYASSSREFNACSIGQIEATDENTKQGLIRQAWKALASEGCSRATMPPTSSLEEKKMYEKMGARTVSGSISSRGTRVYIPQMDLSPDQEK